MIPSIKKEFLSSNFLHHAKLHFTSLTLKYLDFNKIIFCHWSEYKDLSGKVKNSFILPFDIPDELVDSSSSLAFSNQFTSFALRSTISLQDDNFILKNFGHSLWYVDSNQNMIPSWALSDTIIANLFLTDEISKSHLCDEHGRIIAKETYRYYSNQLLEPTVNNYFYALTYTYLSLLLPSNQNITIAKKCSVVLSHDLDSLRSDNIFSQLKLLKRSFCNIFSSPRISLFSLFYLLRNQFQPYYIHKKSLTDIYRLEESLGFDSINYILLGKCGRFYARTAIRHIFSFFKHFPREFSRINFGVHYNYDYLDSPSSLPSSIHAIKSLPNINYVSSGRAHYLRYKPCVTEQHLSKSGIRIDESLGYVDNIGFRSGIAGPYLSPFCFQSDNGYNDLISLPLFAMDAPLLDSFPSSYQSIVSKVVDHLSVVGGTFSFLYHHDFSFYSDDQNVLSFYENILMTLSQKNVRNLSISSILSEFTGDNSYLR